MGGVCTGGSTDSVHSLDSSVAVLPNPGATATGSGPNDAIVAPEQTPLSPQPIKQGGETTSNKPPPAVAGTGSASASGLAASSAASPPLDHPNSIHYRSFAPDSVGVADFHTRKRDHSGLTPGTLDEDGLLAHTDFDIDLTRCDPDNEDHFAEFVARRTVFEENLRLFYDRTPKLPLQPLPANITYVRPFLSSTFKDFNEERNILFAGSFPRLEKLCNERNLFFAPLDLRWGVTSEQSGSGQVIKICLEEIDRSRPYFVCSLGFRNGWALMPSDNPQDQYVQLLEKTFALAEESQFPWIQKAHDRSVTELEILHGALNDPSLSPRSFFYFRDVSFLRNLPKSARRLFAEIGESEKRLQQLKTRIVAAGFRIRYFNTPQQMSDLLEEDLRLSIEADFPIQRLTPLDREMKDHQAFAEMRTRVYVGGEKYVAALDSFLLDESDGAPQVCVISGASGAGKSSLLANWMKRVKARAKSNGFPGKRHALLSAEEESLAAAAGRAVSPAPRASPSPPPGSGSQLPALDGASPAGEGGAGARIFHWNMALFLDRYIGSTSDSTQPGTLLRWILQEMSERRSLGGSGGGSSGSGGGSSGSGGGGAGEAGKGADSKTGGGAAEDGAMTVPQDPKKIVEDFPEWLTLASSSAPVLLVLDGLDQLYEEDDAHHLLWLPKSWPRTVKVVLSTIHGSLTHRNLVERANSAHAANQAAASSAGLPPPVTKNTSFLSIDNVSDAQCLQLIRTFLGSYGKNLDGAQEARIMACERTRNPLYLITFLQEVRVFGSFENLSKRIDHYMEARSVSEMFLKVIGRLEEDFDASAGLPLVRMTLSLMMVARRGLNEVELKGALELAMGVSAKEGTFPNMEFSALMLRLDQQLVDQRGLRKFSHNYLKTAVETKYFTRAPKIAAASDAAAVAPAAVPATPSPFPPIAHTSQSFIRKILADYFRSLPSGVSERKVEEAPWHLWTILHESMEQGAVEEEEDDLADAAAAGAAITTGKKIGGALASSRKLDLGALQRELQEQITDLEMFERLRSDGVYDLHKYWLLLESIKGPAHVASEKAAAALAKKSGTAAPVAMSYTAAAYAAALKRWSEESKPPPSPLAIAEKAESIGTFLIGTDRYLGSECFLDQALAIRTKEQGPNHAEVELLISKKANLFYRQGRYEEALPLYQQSLALVEKSTEAGASVRSSVLRTSIAGLLKEQGKFAESQPLYEQSLQDKIALLGRKHPVVAVSMSNLAELHLRLHNPSKALPLYQESLSIMESERGRSHPEVATIVSSLASCYMQLSQFEEALKLYDRARRIKEELLGPQHVSVAVVLNNLAATYQKMGETSKALKLLERSLKIRQSVHGNDSPLIAQTLTNLGDVYLEMKKYRSASSFFAQAVEIMTADKGPWHVDLMGTLTSQAKLHYDKQEFEQALPIYLRQWGIMERAYGPDDGRVQQCLNNIGMVHQSMERFDLALPWHLRELRVARLSSGGSNKHPRVADVLMILGVLFVSMDRTDVGLALFRRVYVLRRDALGADAEATLEARGWISDLSDDAEAEASDEALAKLTEADVPEPQEVGESAQQDAVTQTNAQSASATGSASGAAGSGGGGGAGPSSLSVPGGAGAHRAQASVSGLGSLPLPPGHAPSKSASLSLPPIGLPSVASPRSGGGGAPGSLLPPIGGGLHKPSPSLGGLPAIGKAPALASPLGAPAPLRPPAALAAPPSVAPPPSASPLSPLAPLTPLGGAAAPPKKKKAIVFS